MNIKQYLGQVNRLKQTIFQKQFELDQLRQSLAGLKAMDYSRERVQSSHSTDPAFVAKLDRIFKTEARLEEEIYDFICIRHEIIQQIQSMDNPLYSEILFQLYVEGNSLKEAAFNLKISYNAARERARAARRAFLMKYSQCD